MKPSTLGHAPSNEWIGREPRSAVRVAMRRHRIAGRGPVTDSKSAEEA